MANDEIHPVSIYGSARSVAAMRTPDHMLTKVESNRIVATDCSSGPVLVVDDDPAVRHLISDYFGQHGITTVSATGRSAVARELARGDTSAIILDLHLGQDDGFDLLREIRSSSDLPVIILTVVPAMKLTVVSDSNSVPTTPPPSRSVSANCMPGSAPCCGAV